MVFLSANITGKSKSVKEKIMIANISKKLTDRLLLKSVIEKDSWEIYYFGIYQLILNAVDMTTILILGIVFNEIWQAILFIGAFAVLRKYGGGYHASTPLRCYLLTTFITITALSVMKYIEMKYFVYFILLFVSSVVILIASPVESENKPLDMIEKMLYRKKALAIWGVETSLAIIFAILKVKSVFVCITMAEVVLSFALIYEIVKKSHKLCGSLG